jgi:hypothetical protein
MVVGTNSAVPNANTWILAMLPACVVPLPLFLLYTFFFLL